MKEAQIYFYHNV